MSFEITDRQLRDHFKAALADAEALVKATADLSGEGLGETRTRARESLRVAKARLEETQETFLLRARGTANSTDAFVRERPWEAIAVVGAVGILVGLLLARR